MANIGIVCEGSHDFCFLKEVMDELLKSKGYQQNTFEALQPKVDATSMQVDGGGYEAVRQWLLTNKRVGLRKYFTPSLFATSQVYDAIVIQIDGDVADLSTDFKISPYSASFTSVHHRVASLKSWVFSLAEAEPALAGNLIAAIPTLQMEAWILAALQPAAINVEARSRKRGAKRFLRRRFSGSAVDQVKLAGVAARSQLANMAAKASSFSLFQTDLAARFP